MRRTWNAPAVLAAAVLGMLAAAEARADDGRSPSEAFDRAHAAHPLPLDAAPVAVLPLPLPWDVADDAPGTEADAVLTGGGGACAQAPCASRCCGDRWRLTLTLPIWIPSISGTFASGGVSAHGDRSPPDLGGILEEFLPDAASSLEFAFMGRVTVEKGPFTLMADGFYASVSETLDWKIRDEDTTGSLDAGILRVFGAWQTSRRLGCGPCAPTLRYGPLLGARGHMVDVHIDRATGDDLDGEKTWIDPIVGLKADLTFRNGASIGLLADVGSAFDGAHYSWSVSAELTWPLGRGGHWFVLGGWTILNVDYDVPLGDADLEIHLHLSGPHVGFTYRF